MCFENFIKTNLTFFNPKGGSCHVCGSNAWGEYHTDRPHAWHSQITGNITGTFESGENALLKINVKNILGVIYRENVNVNKLIFLS